MTSPNAGHDPVLALSGKLGMPRFPGTRNTALYLAVAGMLATVMIVVGLIALSFNLMSLGPVAFTIALFGAVLPVPMYIGVFLWLDRFEPEPPVLLILAFLWGATVSIFAAGCMNTIFGALAQEVVANPRTARQLMASFSAPLTEETWKGIAVLSIFLFRRSDFDGILDGIIYGGVTALGFAMVENVQYYGGALVKGGVAGMAITYVIRGIMSPYAHLLFTSMIGIGFGLAATTRNVPLKFAFPILGWMVAMFLHFLWNTIPGLFGNYGLVVLFISYFIFWVPAFGILIGLVFWSLRRESRMIMTELGHYVEAGELTREEAGMLARLWPRMTGRGVGPAGNTPWGIRRKYTRLATALAFYRHRVARGHSPADAELEAQHLLELRQLRGKTGLPGTRPTT